MHIIEIRYTISKIAGICQLFLPSVKLCDIILPISDKYIKEKGVMSIRKSIVMMTNTGTNWNVVGDPVRANAYYGYTDGIVTCQVIYQNFVGGFGIQGTLALDPKPEDWFWIKINPMGDINTPYVIFPIDNFAPTGQNGGDTGSFATTFIGNFVYLRAVVTRDFIQPAPAAGNASGTAWVWGQIDKVMISL